MAAVGDVLSASNGACTALIEITGMTCASCVLTIEKAVSSIKGVHSVVVSLPSEQAEIHYDSAVTGVEELLSKIDTIGFDAHLTSDGPDATADDSESDADTARAVFEVLGMTCASCVRTIEKAIGRLDGIKSVIVSLPMQQADVQYDPAIIGSAEVISAVAGAGFDVSLEPESKGMLRHSCDFISVRTRRLHIRLLMLHTDNLLDDVKNSAERQSARYSGEQRSAVKRLIFALVFTVPLITITMGLGKGWFGLTSSEHSRLRTLDHVLARGFDVNTLVQLVLTTPVQFISGWVFHESAWLDLRRRRLGMNFLISAGTTAAYLYSCISVILGLTSGMANGDALFFDTSALLISFILLGKMMEKVARHRASNAVGKLMNLRPATAVVMTAWPNVQREASDVPVSTLRAGDVVKVVRGTAVPSDGVVVQGTATIDESMLTGESMPVSKVRQLYIPRPYLCQGNALP
jgi:Cu+-exporting ATPase